MHHRYAARLANGTGPRTGVCQILDSIRTAYASSQDMEWGVNTQSKECVCLPTLVRNPRVPSGSAHSADSPRVFLRACAGIPPPKHRTWGFLIYVFFGELARPPHLRTHAFRRTCAGGSLCVPGVCAFCVLRECVLGKRITLHTHMYDTYVSTYACFPAVGHMVY